MEPSNRSVQTAFRFRPELLTQIKAKARFEGMTLNAYVESVLQAALKSEDKYKSLFEQIGRLTQNRTFILDVSKATSTLSFTEEELESDPRLDYLVKKHLK